MLTTQLYTVFKLFKVFDYRYLNTILALDPFFNTFYFKVF